jgi:hypothetical protein
VRYGLFMSSTNNTATIVTIAGVEHYAVEGRFVVTSPLGTMFHGAWASKERAAKFARSLGGLGVARAVNLGNVAEGVAWATVEETTPYLFAPAYGLVLAV